MNSTRTETLRTFIAIDLPADLKKQIATIQQRFKPLFSRAKVSWVKPDSMHLTLKFLGDVLSTDIPWIIQACDEARAKPVFDLHLNRIGFFPGSNKPKVLWCGYDHSEALSEIQQHIEKTLVPMGFAAGDKPFVAHLTLARIKEIGNKPSSAYYVDLDAIRAETEKNAVSFHHSVSGIKLIKSRLSPKGSEYSVLHEWRLQQGSA